MNPAPAWPTARLDRTIVSLESTAQELDREAEAKEAADAERERNKKIAAMVKNPESTLKEVDQLARKGSTANYKKAAELLAELQSALAGKDNANLPIEHAQMLVKKYSTFTRLTRALRRQGLIPKK